MTFTVRTDTRADQYGPDHIVHLRGDGSVEILTRDERQRLRCVGEQEWRYQCR